MFERHRLRQVGARARNPGRSQVRFRRPIGCGEGTCDCELIWLSNRSRDHFKRFAYLKRYAYLGGSGGQA